MKLDIKISILKFLAFSKSKFNINYTRKSITLMLFSSKTLFPLVPVRISISFEDENSALEEG